jgi:hypothetical protein
MKEEYELELRRTNDKLDEISSQLLFIDVNIQDLKENSSGEDIRLHGISALIWSLHEQLETKGKDITNLLQNSKLQRR